MSEKPLNGKVAVITGAGRGLGRSIALALAAAGANIAICSRTQTELDAVKEEAEALGVRCHSEAVDLSNAENTETFCKSIVTALGPVHILVNNAGAELEIRPIADSDPDKWWKTV
ncbi:MAG: SDR family NAD(P)-dependent oxidoreductase, partial [Pseudomonadota bacterium]